MHFDYHVAFQRNLGFVSLKEQDILRRSRVAIAGLGGTGSAQVAAFSRMGVGAFSLADLDTFELANFNRQSGATIETLGEKKTTVANSIVHNINPEADARLFENGITADNINDFLDDVDIVVDSLDFYCFKERFLLYKAARELGLWVLTSPPLGFGFTVLSFDPEGMKFEEYFDFKETDPEAELAISLFAGIIPNAYILKYLDTNEISLNSHRLPSVGAAPFMIAGVIVAEAVNILLDKFPPKAVPTIYQFDALLREYRKVTYRWGMRSPWQRLRKKILRKKLQG